MTRNVRTIFFGFAMVAATIAHAEPTLESVENEVEALWAKINGFSAQTTTDAKVPMGPMNMTSHATGTLQCLKQGDVTLFRLDMINKLDTGIPLPGKLAGIAEQKVLSVFDGKVLYNEMEAMGKKQAFKMSNESANKQSPTSGRSMFQALREKGDLKLLPEATVDGKPAYVVEVTPNEEMKRTAPTPVSLIKVYISKDVGLQVKMEVFGEDGTPTSTTVYSNIDTNAKLSPDQFVYKAPEGVTVQDMSDMKLPGRK